MVCAASNVGRYFRIGESQATNRLLKDHLGCGLNSSSVSFVAYRTWEVLSSSSQVGEYSRCSRFCSVLRAAKGSGETFGESTLPGNSNGSTKNSEERVVVLVVGGGGREHALCYALQRSPSCDAVFCAPGNAGVAHSGNATCTSDLDISDSFAVISFCHKWGVGLVVIGPEAPLVAGLANDLVKGGIPTFGPSSEAAALEGSKNFMKKLCDKYGIPTAKVLMMRLESDLAQVLLAACRGELSNVTLKWSPGSAMVVVMASHGYPGAYKKGTIIRNLEEAELLSPTVKIFHAGTTLDPDANFVATGGRVLGVTAKGKDIDEARDRAYDAVEAIDWPEGFFRHDIGWRVLRHKQLAG